MARQPEAKVEENAWPRSALKREKSSLGKGRKPDGLRPEGRTKHTVKENESGTDEEIGLSLKLLRALALISPVQIKI